MTDKQQGRTAAQLGLCPVCNLGPVRVTMRDTDGSQEGVCENHEPFVFLVRGSETGPWRLVEPE